MTTVNEQLDMATMTVADVAVAFPNALEILTSHNLDYCCNGHLSFIEACESAGFNPDGIWHSILLAKTGHPEEGRIRFDTWGPALLIDFILKHHHNYIRKAIPQIKELLDKVCDVHGDDNPVLPSIRDDFNDLSDELLDHMPKEEEVLFPAILKMFKRQSSLEPSINVKTLQIPIVVMEHEHEEAGKLVKSIRSLSQNYMPPAYACPTLLQTYRMLHEFDSDLMQHIHLENNILFPMVKETRIDSI